MDFVDANALLAELRRHPRGLTADELVELLPAFTRNRMSVYLRTLQVHGYVKRVKQSKASYANPGRLPDLWLYVPAGKNGAL